MPPSPSPARLYTADDAGRDEYVAGLFRQGELVGNVRTAGEVGIVTTGSWPSSLR